MKGFYESPRWSAEALYCPNPMTFDQYSNCSHGCIYCFAQYQRGLIRGENRQAYFEGKYKPVNVEKVKNIFTNGKNQFSEYIRQKKIMQWGGMSDPFCWIEKKENIGLQLMRFFREIDYPIVFATKNTWWLNDKRYTELFENNKNWNVRISIITDDRKISKIIEPNVPSPLNRLKGIEKLSKLNIGSNIIRIRPFIFGITDKSYENLIRLGKESGATNCSVGFFCFDPRIKKENLKILDNTTCIDNKKFYYQFSSNKGSPLRLNRNIKRKYIKNGCKLAKENGLKFSVGDRHFKELADGKYKLDNKTDTKYSRGQFAFALQYCKEKDFVAWNDIEWDMKHFENVKYSLFNEPCESRSYFYGFTIKDFLHFLWNNPWHSLSPYRIFEGIMKPDRLDENGNVIYKYNKGRE